MLRVEMLPAREGDCLLVTYGRAAPFHHVLVDGGRAATYAAVRKRLSQLSPAERTFELLVVTHVDRDHIEGAVKIMEDDAFPVTFRDVWFNGFEHLQDPQLEPFGAVQGERLSDALMRRGHWNEARQRRSIEIGRLRKVTIPGGLSLKLVSPDRPKLEALIPRWKDECQKAGLVLGVKPSAPPREPGIEAFGALDIEELAATPFEPDASEPNGTSIAVLAEFDGKRVMLAADGHADRLAASLRPLAKADGGRLRLDAFKLPHHGSRYNVSRDLIGLVDCPRYLFSTNGSQFHHPHAEAVARVLKFGRANPDLVFNYRSDESLIWDDPVLKRKHRYTASYPSESDNGTIAVDL
jgi:hypothetical protein